MSYDINDMVVCMTEQTSYVKNMFNSLFAFKPVYPTDRSTRSNLPKYLSNSQANIVGKSDCFFYVHIETKVC